MLDLSTTLQLGEIASFLLGGAAVILKLGEFRKAVQYQGDEITDLKTEIKKIADLVTAMAVQTARLDSMTQRITMLEGWYDELRRGKGWITGMRWPTERID